MLLFLSLSARGSHQLCSGEVPKVGKKEEHASRDDDTLIIIIKAGYSRFVLSY
jgi:hypothetical protein